MDKLSLRNAIKEAINKSQLETIIARILDDEEGFARAKELQQAVADRLRRAGWETHAIKVKNCFSRGHLELWDRGEGDFQKRWMPRISYMQHPRGHDVAIGACGLPKLCPFHARIETRRRLERYLPYVQVAVESGQRLKFVTLTTMNVSAGRLQEGWDEIWSAWAKLRRSDCWTASAAIATFEVTWSDYDGGSWNVHLHILAAVPQGVDFSYRRIQQRWQEITGARIVDFKNVKSWSKEGLVKGVAEVLKYVSKFEVVGTLSDSAFAEWVQTVFGRRTLRSYGQWYRLQDLDLDEEEPVGELVAAFDWCWSEAGGLRVFLIQVNKSLTAEEHSQEFGSYELRNLALARAGPG